MTTLKGENCALILSILIAKSSIHIKKSFGVQDKGTKLIDTHNTY